MEKYDLLLSTSQSQYTTNAINCTYALDLIVQILFNCVDDKSI